MAITDRNTALILGAGVSVPFGLPLGGHLIDCISNNLKEEFKKLEVAAERNFERSSFQYLLRSTNDAKYFSEIPTLGAIAHKYLVPDGSSFKIDSLNTEFERLKTLNTLLDDQTSETIDDFIVENPSFAEITKICIAAEFVKRLYDFSSSSNSLSLRPVSMRNAKNRIKQDSGRWHAIKSRNWIHLLINIVRHGIRADKVSCENKVKIITFNYDQILECVLDKQFRNTEFGNDENGYQSWDNYIEIIHPHGQCGDLEDNILNPSKTILRWANGISVVNEDSVSDTIGLERKKARDTIFECKEIYACGFSFSGPNQRLLGLDIDRKVGYHPLVSFCNYDSNIGLSKSVSRMKWLGQSKRIEEESGSHDSPLGVSDWLKLGSVGELPG